MLAKMFEGGRLGQPQKSINELLVPPLFEM